MAQEPCDKFVVPQKILNTLNEHTHNCFCLFTFDENGGLQVYLQADNRAYRNALIKDIRVWSAVLDNQADNIIASSLMPPDHEDGENAHDPD